MSRPELFFPWLARVVTERGAARCTSVVCRADGSLVFELAYGGETARVRWSLFRDRGLGAPFHEGSLGWLDETSRRSPFGRDAIRQVARRVNRLLAVARPPLLERRNREVSELVFDPDLPSRLAPDLLRVGVTRVGSTVLDEVTASPDVVRFRFGEVVLLLCPPWTTQDGAHRFDYGPCQLVVAPGSERFDGARGAMDLVGYVVSLATHEGMTAVRRQGGEGEATPEQDEPPPNPFFMGIVPSENQMMSALFGTGGSVPSVLHSDRECAHFCSYVGGHHATPHRTHWPLRPQPAFIRTLRITDTKEHEAIMSGVEERFRDLLRKAESTDRAGMIFTLDTCVSNVIGDHIPSVVGERADVAQVPVMCLRTTLDQYVDNAQLFWEFVVEQAQASPARPDQTTHNRINLVGFGHDRTPGLRELVDLLGAAGVVVNTSIMPTFDGEAVARFGHAALNVVFPSSTVTESFSKAARVCEAPVVCLPAPFGIEGTRGWIEAIVARLGMPQLPEGWLAAGHRDAVGAWERLRSQANDARVALVVMAGARMQPDPLFREGVPVVSLLEEMGFRLGLFVLSASGEVDAAARRTCDELRRSLRRESRHDVVPVADLEALQAALEACESSLGYTEILEDRRILGAGKIPLGFDDFEVGVAGAVRSLDRLCARARTPFHRRYARYLPQPRRVR